MLWLIYLFFSFIYFLELFSDLVDLHVRHQTAAVNLPGPRVDLSSAVEDEELGLVARS